MRPFLAWLILCACGNPGQLPEDGGLPADAMPDTGDGGGGGGGEECPPAEEPPVQPPAGPPGPLAGAEVDLGIVPLLGRTMGTAQLTNPSSAAVAIGGMSTTGRGFAISSTTCGPQLAAGASCSVVVSYLAGRMLEQVGWLAIENGGGVSAVKLRARVSHIVSLGGFGPSGSVRVTSSPPGIDSQDSGMLWAYFAEPVTLTAALNPGFSIVRWHHPGCGTAPQCTVTPGFDLQTARLTVRSATQHVLHVRFDGNAPADVRLTLPSGDHYQCRSECWVPVDSGTVQVLGSSPSTFAGMSGACSTTTQTCSFDITADAELTVTAMRAPNEEEVYLFGDSALTGVGPYLSDTACSAYALFGGPYQGLRRLVSGKTIWMAPVTGSANLQLTQGGVVVVDSTGLRKLDAGGEEQWRATSSSGNVTGHRALVVSPTGDIAHYTYLGAGSLFMYKPDGQVSWSVTGLAQAPSVRNPIPSLAFDAQGLLHLPALVNGAELQILRYAADGSPAPPLPAIATNTLTSSSIALEGDVLAVSSVEAYYPPETRIVVLSRRTTSGVLAFTHTLPIDVRRRSLVQLTGDSTWWIPDSFEFDLRRYAADGSLAWSLARPHLVIGSTRYGLTVGDLTRLPDGRVLVYSGYTSPASDVSRGVLQIFKP